MSEPTHRTRISRPGRGRALAGLTIGLAIAIAAACGSKKPSTSGPGGSGPSNQGVLVQHDSLPEGLTLRLSDGLGGAARGERVPVAPAERLDEARTKALLARLQPLATDGKDRQEFALRPRSLPPPRTGETISTTFPPPDAGEPPPSVTGTAGALTVVRGSPEGDVPLAPHLSVTFSQPMVAVTAHDDASRTVPVKLSPQPPGRWRWVGTRTILFDPEVRFPQATEYTVEIPAGTRSAAGAALKEAKRWTFATPAPRLQQSWPQGEPHRRDTLMFALFDQRIEPSAVLATIRLEAGKRSYAVRAATADEIAGDATIRNLIDAADKNEQAGRYVVFRAQEPLPADTRIQVTIGPGTPSAEGPRTTSAAQSFHFKTYGPLRVEEARCSWGRDCPPGAPYFIRFSNPLDEEAFDDAAIVIDPNIAGRKIELHGNYLYIHGRTEGRSRYRVTLPAALKDTFGQTLGKEQTFDWRVGDAQPSLWGPQGLVVLDPAARAPRYDLFSVNYDKLKVRLYRVEPSDWSAFVGFMHGQHRNNLGAPGTKVFDQILEVGGKPDRMQETQIDLSPALAGGLGHVVIDIEPTPWSQPYPPPRLRAWVQATRLGLDAFVDQGELVAWTTNLADGTPRGDVSVEIAPVGTKGDTDARGVARLPLSAKGAGHLLLARSGSDVALLPENVYWWNEHGGWRKTARADALRWYVFDDRRMYRPDEEVHLKGWIRRIGTGEGGDVGAVGDLVTALDYTVFGPRGNELHKGKVELGPLGGFDLAFRLPKTPNLGWARVSFTAHGRAAGHDKQYQHSFQIQEFRRPEFEVTTAASQGPHLVGEHAEVTANASYYAGGGLANADVHWQVSARPGRFVPPNRDDFTFGIWVPWWGYYHRGPYLPEQTTTFAHQGRTDGTGKHVLRLDFVSVKPARAMEVTAQATVTDVNRQAWASSANLLVHPSAHYVGLKSERMFVEKGVPLKIDAIVVDHDGNAIAGRKIAVTAARLAWTYKKGEWVEEEEDVQSCLPDSGADAVRCEFETPEGGTYRITARVSDDEGRPNESQITVWVAGGARPPARNVEQEEVQIVPDKKEYAPGETARLLVQSPFFPADGLLSLRRDGIGTLQHIRFEGPTAIVEIPIEDAHTPNVYAQIDIVGSAPRLDDAGNPAPALPRRPAFAKGSINLIVPPRQRTLRLDVAPRARRVAPGEKTSVSVRVRDAAGRPVKDAEVAIVVVDEAILSLSGYQLPDPLEVFYQQRGPGAQDYHLRANVALARPDQDQFGAAAGGDMARDEAAEAAPSAGAPPPAPMMDKSAARTASAPGAVGGQAAQPIAVRTNFDPLAVFSPAMKTGADGTVSVPVAMPDNLTRYRVMVVAAAGERNFGSGESSITARMPLMVRPSPPRFLNFGDRFELPVVLQNQTDAPMQVEVAVRASNAALTAGPGRRLTVPANDRVEVRFPAAAELAGTARFQIAAASGPNADAAELALPVWTPATTEAFATYGEIDAGAIAQPVALPEDVVEQFGGIEITTSSTQLQALTDAFLYLVDYPYECSEQLASRILAVAALRDVLTAFSAEGLPPPDEILGAVRRDLESLRMMQNHDGGFGFWTRGQPSWPFVSIHVAHALARAKDKGFEVPADLVQRSLQYLRQIEQRIPSYYPIEVRRSITAYALYVRKRLGDADPVRARGLMKEAGLEALSLEAVGWLLSVMAGDGGSKNQIAAIHRHLDNRATETAGAANFTTSYSDGAHLLLHSNRRADGVILEALIETKPKSDLIPKVVRGLLAHRTRGRWSNTQDNAFVLLSLDRYFHEYEKVTPNFVARAWLGDRFAGEHAFRGRTTERHHLDIPMSYLAKVGKADVTLQKNGAGRLYYRIGMTYAPKSLRLTPADHGFAVERLYEAVDDPKDVVRQADGTWTIKAGARVRVRVTMVAENRRYHVALVDPLPAGLEPMNPELAVTGAVPQDPNKPDQPYWWWVRPWYEHQNLRDDRVEAFASLLWEGVHEYSYVTRATTPGRFVVPPAKAEEMYMPETFGRSASDVVVVE